ncbi:MAG TPA: hypothetical protein VIM56_10680 [Rhizomicrobium sp.]
MADIADLLSWRVDGGDTDLHAPRVQAHPHFAAAARALAANSLAAGEADKTLDGIFKDAGRYVAAMWSMYLHVSGGLTLPRLKEVCASSGFLSPGRARALLIYMRYLGYIELAPQRVRGEPTRYVPTSHFRESWRAHHRAMLGAACVIEPSTQIVIDRLGDDAVMDSISRLQAEGLLSLTRVRVRDRDAALVRVFMHRHAGNQILFTLVNGPGEDFPPRGGIPFSIATAAQRFGVSRIHVRRVLNDALRENFLAIADRGVAEFSELARSELHYSYSMQLAQLLASAAGAWAECAARDQPILAAS